VYAWIQNAITVEEGVSILEKYEDPAEAFCVLLQTITEKLS